ncbi:MAG: hypothetical protein AB1714_20460 [Acidobacteriota bacterium]
MVPSQNYGFALLCGAEEAEAPPRLRLAIWRRLRSWYYRWTESALAQERALKKARKASSIEVCYPSQLSPEDAAQLFARRVREEMKHHIIWLLIDFPLLIPASLAMFIPGPNVFFLFWAIRILGHYHAYEGGKRLLRPDAVRYRPSADLGEWHKVLRDRISEQLEHAVERLEHRTGLRNLRSILLKKIEVKHKRKA